jgi:hypothetical protein
MARIKVTKEKDTRSLRRTHYVRFPALLAKPGASLTRRAQNTRLGLDQKSRDYPRLHCGARLAPTGIGATDLQPSRGGVFNTPYGAPEPRKALGERPQGRRQGCLRLPRRDRMSRRGRAGPKAAEARESLRHPGRAFSCLLLFARAKRSHPGSGAEHPGFKHAATGRSTERVQGRNHPQLLNAAVGGSTKFLISIPNTNGVTPFRTSSPP